jgi:iron complex outermembrane receptor protein
MNLKDIFIVSLFFVPLTVLKAQDNDTLKKTPVELNEIEITTTSNKSLLKQAGSINKLSTQELKRGNGLFLDDAINSNVPGVFMQRRTLSAGQQFNIRGYGNGVRGTNGISNNFDGQGYKVYLNGIPITDAEGITVMDDIDFNSIGQVDVLKGPSGSLYGLAIAGVVNLKSIQAPKGKTSIGQEALFGSYGLRRLTTQVMAGTENGSVLINYGRQDYDGFIDHTKSMKDFVNVIGDFQPNRKQHISTYIGYSNSYDERQGELTIGQYDTLNYSGNPSYIKNNAHSNVISFRTGINHTYKFTRYISNSVTVFGSGLNSNVSSAGGWTDKSPINYGARSTFNFDINLGEKLKLEGILGGEYQKQLAQVIGYAMVTNPANPDPNAYNVVGTMRSNQAYRTETSSLFTEWTLSLPKDFYFTAGIGLSTMMIDLSDRLYVAGNTKPVNYSKGYDNMFSPKLAINKIFKHQISVYASYNKGYKAPVSSYFFIPTTGQVNKDLKAETGDQFEVGTKGDILKNKLHYELAAFNIIYANKMTAKAVPLDPPAVGTAYSYIVNSGGQDNKGIEFLIKYKVFDSETSFIKLLSPFFNFCYSDFRYVDFTFETLSKDKKSAVVTDYNGKPVAGVAPSTANGGIDLETRIGIYANVNYQYREAMPFTSDGTNKTKPYGVLNAKLGYRILLIKHIDINAYFGAVNITGTQYPYMVFVNQLPDAYMPAPNKINYFGGLSLKYIF